MLKYNSSGKKKFDEADFNKEMSFPNKGGGEAGFFPWGWPRIPKKTARKNSGPPLSSFFKRVRLFQFSLHRP